MDRIYRKVQLSCDLFWGYNVEIDLTNPGLQSKRDIINYILNSLRLELISKNMDILREKLDEKYYHYHIHGMNNDNINNDNMNDDNFINILKRMPVDTVIYVCRHEN